ncbi:MAG: hypothetical protein JXB04_01390 [Kiritimatiellae bacterium]|nr:hypothetical protein [Kiritimatiellia bacterium]
MRLRFLYGTSDEFMGVEPNPKGYWGFIRCRADFERERDRVTALLEEQVAALRDEGRRIELLAPLTFGNADMNNNRLIARAAELREADVNILLQFFPTTGACPPQGSAFYFIHACSKFLVNVDLAEPRTYGGTLFAPPDYQHMLRRDPRLVRTVFLVESGLDKLRRILRAIYGVEQLRASRQVCVGGMFYFGGWVTARANLDRFGCAPHRFYTFDEFQADFETMLAGRADEIRAAIEAFTGPATRVVEPTGENLRRAAAYYLVLRKYLEDNESDWITVNCLSDLLQRVQATPCMAFAMLNDSGLVGTCEADPTAGPFQYLMRHVAGKPAFFNDPMVNEGRNTLVLAHCTSPTKLAGWKRDGFPYEVRTHHESNTGATPRPVFERGTVTVVATPYEQDRMLILRGEAGMPEQELPICRSQVEVKVSDATAALDHWQGFHWNMVYGDYVDEMKHVAKIFGMDTIVLM